MSCKETTHQIKRLSAVGYSSRAPSSWHFSSVVYSDQRAPCEVGTFVVDYR